MGFVAGLAVDAKGAAAAARDDHAVGSSPMRAAVPHGSWLWSVLRSSRAASARVVFRSAGRGAELEVTFWDTSDLEVAAFAPMLFALGRAGVAVQVTRSNAEEVARDSPTQRRRAAVVAGAPDDVDAMLAVSG